MLCADSFAEGRITLVGDELLFGGRVLCTVGRISVLREEVCTVGRIHVLREEFLYCVKNFCTFGRISVLMEEYLHYV